MHLIKKALYASLACVLLGIALNTPSLAQEPFHKFDQSIPSDDKSGLIDLYTREFERLPDKRAVVLVTVPSLTHKIANTVAYAKGIREYLRLGGIGSSEEDVVVREGKGETELWIYPKGMPAPVQSDLLYGFAETKGRTLVGENCYECGPAVPMLSTNNLDLETIESLMTRYPDLILRLEIQYGNRESEADAKTELGDFKTLILESGSIPEARVEVSLSAREDSETGRLLVFVERLPKN